MSGTDSKAGGQDYLLLFMHAKSVSEEILKKSRGGRDREPLDSDSAAMKGCGAALVSGCEGHAAEQRRVRILRRWAILKWRDIDPMRTAVTQRKAEVEALCRRYHVRRLDLFGSAAAGQDEADHSDLDLLVEFESFPAGAYADAYFGLLQALEALFGRAVDLVVASAIANPYFRQSVERTRTLLYAA